MVTLAGNAGAMMWTLLFISVLPGRSGRSPPGACPDRAAAGLRGPAATLAAGPLPVVPVQTGVLLDPGAGPGGRIGQEVVGRLLPSEVFPLCGSAAWVHGPEPDVHIPGYAVMNVEAPASGVRRGLRFPSFPWRFAGSGRVPACPCISMADASPCGERGGGASHLDPVFILHL